MKIILVSSHCSDDYYRRLTAKRIKAALDSSQKFFRLFTEGFRGMDDIRFINISIPPVSRGTYPEKEVRRETCTDGNITYIHVGCKNFPVLKTLTAKRAVQKELKKLLKETAEPTVLVTDPLVLEATKPVNRFRKKFPTVGILTDLPDYADYGGRLSPIKKLLYKAYNRSLNHEMKKLSGYVFLTDAMNDAANPENKPWIRMEALVSSRPASEAPAAAPAKSGKPVIGYFGKLHKEFGMDILMDCIRSFQGEAEFHLYGEGNAEEELRRLAAENPSLILHGVVSVEEAMREERAATILLNPRPSGGAFTQYSFPSKTAEYLQAGRPIVMFSLPGIPKDYDSYLNYPAKETGEALAEKLEEILRLPADRLDEIGQKGKRFIEENVTNTSQAKRFTEFLQEKIGVTRER